MGTIIIYALMTASGHAQEPGKDKAVKRYEENGPEAPTLEFLEFLGEWETKEGQWIDPEEIEQMTIPDPEQEKDENDENH